MIVGIVAIIVSKRSSESTKEISKMLKNDELLSNLSFLTILLGMKILRNYV